MTKKLLYKEAIVRYKSEGSGPCIVLLHGFTESLDIWNDYSKKLSTSYRVLCVDLPGHGESECQGKVHTMEMMAELVKAVLDKESIKECLMIGHSMGGYALMAFVEKYSKMLRGYGLFHSSAFADTLEAKKNRDRAIDLIKQSHQHFISQFIPDLFAKNNREKYQDEINDLIVHTKKMSKEGIVACMEGMKIRTDRSHLLKQSKVPILFIYGQEDSRVPLEKAFAQAALPEDSHAHLIGSIGHMGYIEAREDCLFYIKSFAKHCFY